MKTMTDHDLYCLAYQTLKRDIARHKRIMKKGVPGLCLKDGRDPALEKMEAQKAELWALISG